MLNPDSGDEVASEDSETQNTMPSDAIKPRQPPVSGRHDTIKFSTINVQKNLGIHTSEMLKAAGHHPSKGSAGGINTSFLNTEVFLVQEPRMTNTTEEVADMMGMWNDLGWATHCNHDNPEKKGGGAVILSAPHICSLRLQSCEPPHSSTDSGLDIAVSCIHIREANCGSATSSDSARCACKPEKKLLLASVYRSGHSDHQHNVQLLCDWLKNIKRKSKQYAGLLIAGDFNLHLATAGNTGAATRSSKCKMFEQQLEDLDLGLINNGDMTRFPQGLQKGSSSGSGLDLMITHLPDPVRNVWSKTKIDATSFQGSFEVGPEWHGSDHRNCTARLLWPFRIKRRRGQDRTSPYKKCSHCLGHGCVEAESKRKIEKMMRHHNLMLNTLPGKDLKLNTEESPIFAERVASNIISELLTKPSEEAILFDSVRKHTTTKGGISPWTVDPEQGMTQLANVITKAHYDLAKIRKDKDKHQRDSEGRGHMNRHRRRSKRRPRRKNHEHHCSCPPPEQGDGQDKQRNLFWSQNCFKTLNEWLDARRVAIKLRNGQRATPRGSSIVILSRAAKMRKAFAVASKKRTLHRTAIVQAKRKFWGISADGIDRFTPARELHTVLDLLSNNMSRSSRGDGLAKEIEKRGGATTDQHDSLATRPVSEAADLLTKHFADTTIPLSRDKALETIAKIDERRVQEDRAPYCQEGTNGSRAKIALSLPEKWFQEQACAGGELAKQKAPLEAPPLPKENCLNKRVTTAEVLSQLKDFKKNKAVWHDRQTTEMLAAAGPIWAECFAAMMSLMLLTGKWVGWWKNARMRHLMKQKAKAYSSPVMCGHTRPLSILPAMAKLAELILFARLVYQTEDKDGGTGLGEKQSGFRPFRGTPDNLMSHVQSVKQAWRKGYFVVEVSRDAVKAFDKVFHKGLLYKLKHNHGVEGPLLRLIASFLEGRRAHSILGPHMGINMDLHGGVPQGAVMSPLLYAIDIDRQARLCDAPTSPLLGADTSNANIAYYADDGRIWIILPGPRATDITDWKAECKRRLHIFQDLLDESAIQAALDRQRFSADPSKLQSTAYLPSGWSKDKNEILAALPHLFIEDTEITIGTDPLKALGLTLDSGLTFENHINDKVNAAKRRITVLARLKSMPWYADAHSMLFRVYTPWIASLWEYASVAWGTANPKLLKTIDAVERRALAICLGAPANGPCSRLALLNEAGIHSAQQRRLISAADTWHKICNSDENSNSGIMLKAWKQGNDWKQEVDEAVLLCTWIDIQTEKVLATGGIRGKIKKDQAKRELISPLAFCAAAAKTLQMSRAQVGASEPHGLEKKEQRRCPFSEDPCEGYTLPAHSLPKPVSTSNLNSMLFSDLFPWGTEAWDYIMPILGSAGKRSQRQIDLANAYARAVTRAMQRAIANEQTSVSCATDGASISMFGSSVLVASKYTVQDLWKRHGGGSGTVIAGRQGKLLAAFGTRHGRVSDSAADEMAGMHTVLLTLVYAYLGEDEAIKIDQSGRSTGVAKAVQWETSDRRPPPRTMHIVPGKTVITIACDNQGVVRATRTESLKTQPYKKGPGRAPGYSLHNEIVAAKRLLLAAGATVQVLWIPGHTKSCWMNYTADMMADKAAVSAVYGGEGRNVLHATRPMISHFLKRHTTLLLRNSWFQWYKDEKARDRKARGHAYLEDMILWHGYTCDRTLTPEKYMLECAKPMDRWLAVQREFVILTTSRMAAKAIIRLRLQVPPRNVWQATDRGLSTQQCPWCHDAEDSGKHRFLCVTLLPHRRKLADRLYCAVHGCERAEPRSPAATDHFLAEFFSWNLMVKGDYRLGLQALPKALERYTAPTVVVRQELASITHCYLTACKFYKRVYGSGADVCAQVKAGDPILQEEQSPSSSDEEDLDIDDDQDIYDSSSSGYDSEKDNRADPSWVP
jgi:hypothetical protein